MKNNRKNNRKLTQKEEIQQENNLLKAKLIAENGAHFPEEHLEPLDPKIENGWLNYKLFQDSYFSIELEQNEITTVTFNPDDEKATVNVRLKFSTSPGNGEKKENSGIAIISFGMRHGYWCINSVKIPGFNIR